MEIVFEVSHKKSFENIYKDQLPNDITFQVLQDNVSFGFEIPDEIIIGIVFIVNHIQDNAMWDAIKYSINSFLVKFKPRKQDRMIIELEADGKRYSLSIPEGKDNIEIEIPELLKIIRK